MFTKSNKVTFPYSNVYWHNLHSAFRRDPRPTFQTCNIRVRGLAMVIALPALAFAATFMVGMLPLTNAFGSDLTLAATASEVQRANRTASRQGGQKDLAAKTQHPGKQGKRVEKKRRHKISTYSLLNDPSFKHGTGLNGKSKPGSHSGMGLGTGVDYTVPAGTAPVQQKNVPGATPGPGYKLDADNAAAPSFDCRDKPANTSPGRREMTACFVHKLDKSWKTQTYVSRRSADGNSGWGGGLAVGYDY
jgi:hypothetical protein